ncbi:M23 family metallopeptidase [Gracilimonas sediminicola]|uniref:M23 family metallopeptidase n=1 Tax=Gracilimonas sediminicola TaxID=2952158 RepID=A0A9X2L361_9BACT|nr:M23 family metallopeptidase [Gracilimonas sediminicola]MCP9291473.1 M23 family metallopeptidase [Gracilimonas sediminicola]
MKYLLLIGFTGLLILTGCSDSGVNVSSDQTIFLLEGDAPLPSQNNISWWEVREGKSKSAKPSLSTLSTEQVSKLYKVLDEYSQRKNTPYVAFLSSKKNNKDGKKEKKFKYRYFKLKPNQTAIDKSEGEKAFYFHIFVDPANHEIYQILAVLVPKTEEQIKIVKEWGDKLNGNSSVRIDSSNNRNKSMACTYEEGLVWEPLCGCFSIGTVEVCDQQIDDEDPGGDTGDGPANCYYEPEGCEEDTNPNDDGSSPGGDPNNSSCPAGQVEDGNGNCIDGEVPCQGNPVKNPRIAEQKQNSGLDGGRFTVGDDAVRDGGNRDHKGLDLLVGHGEPLFSMREGEVKAIGNDKDGLGKYVIVNYDVGGGRCLDTVCTLKYC